MVVGEREEDAEEKTGRQEEERGEKLEAEWKGEDQWKGGRLGRGGRGSQRRQRTKECEVKTPQGRGWAFITEGTKCVLSIEFLT